MLLNVIVSANRKWFFSQETTVTLINFNYVD